MIDGSEKRNRQLAFELKIRMFVKSGNYGSQLIPFSLFKGPRVKTQDQRNEDS